MHSKKRSHLKFVVAGISEHAPGGLDATRILGHHTGGAIKVVKKSTMLTSPPISSATTSTTATLTSTPSSVTHRNATQRRHDEEVHAQNLRLKTALSHQIKFIDNAIFHRDGIETQILDNPPPRDSTRPQKIPPGTHPYFVDLYKIPLLSAAQEAHLFRKYNFLKFRAHALQESLTESDAHEHLSLRLAKFEKTWGDAQRTRNTLIQSNLRLVVNVLKHRFAGDELFDNLSDGNSFLMQAVEKFDFARGFRFSTLAVLILNKEVDKKYSTEEKYKRRYENVPEEWLAENIVNPHPNPRAEVEYYNQQCRIDRLLEALDEREQKIVKARFGLDRLEAQNLREIGDSLGVTKERARQIEARALVKLQLFLDKDPMNDLQANGSEIRTIDTTRLQLRMELSAEYQTITTALYTSKKSLTIGELRILALSDPRVESDLFDLNLRSMIEDGEVALEFKKTVLPPVLKLTKEFRDLLKVVLNRSEKRDGAVA